MAQTITLLSGSPLVGSPLVFRVVPSAHGSNMAFHQVRITVCAALETDSDYTPFEFSTPVTSSDAVLFDISSALQAVADRYEYAVTPPDRYPYVKFYLVAQDDWMIDGREYTDQDRVVYPGRLHIDSETSDGAPLSMDKDGYCYALFGSMSDMERLRVSDEQRVTINRFSRKPTSTPEVVFTGVPFVHVKKFAATIGIDSVTSDYPQEFVPGAYTKGPVSDIYTANADGLCVFNPDTDDRFSVYAVPAPKDGIQLRFVNGLGCLESVHLTCLSRHDMKTEVEKHTVARQETLTHFSRSLVVKQPGREQWILSSLPLDEQWAAWYAHELLIARRAWVAVPDAAAQSGAAEWVWIPVVILPGETTTLIDRQKGGALTVQITVELGIDGSPLL